MKIAAIIFLIASSLMGFTRPIEQQAKDVAIGPAIPRPVVPPTTIVRPMPQRFPYAQPFAASTFTGTLVYKFTIMVKSSIPASNVIACIGTASIFDTSGRTIEESAGVAASRSGSTATCTVMIPYTWILAGGATDMVLLGFSIDAPVAGAAALPNRISTQQFASIHVPPSGTTTTEILTPTI